MDKHFYENTPAELEKDRETAEKLEMSMTDFQRMKSRIQDRANCQPHFDKLLSDEIWRRRSRIYARERGYAEARKQIEAKKERF